MQQFFGFWFDFKAVLLVIIMVFRGVFLSNRQFVSKKWKFGAFFRQSAPFAVIKLHKIRLPNSGPYFQSIMEL